MRRRPELVSLNYQLLFSSFLAFVIKDVVTLPLHGRFYLSLKDLETNQGILAVYLLQFN